SFGWVDETASGVRTSPVITEDTAITLQCFKGSASGLADVKLTVFYPPVARLTVESSGQTISVENSQGDIAFALNDKATLVWQADHADACVLSGLADATEVSGQLVTPPLTAGGIVRLDCQ